MRNADKEILKDVIKTLDTLTVTGIGNMSKICGCAQALNNILIVNEKTTAKEEEGEND